MAGRNTVFDNGGYIGRKGTFGGVWSLAAAYDAKAAPVLNIVTTGLVMHVDAGNTLSYSGTGTTWKDLTGTVADGTLRNSPTYSAANGGHFQFNGSNQFVNWPNSTALDNQAITMEVWTKTNSLNQNGFWFEKGAVNSQYSFFQEGGNILYRLNGSTTIQLTTSSFLNTTTWYQLVATYTPGAARVYANTTQIGTSAPSVTLNANPNGMSVGAYGGTAAGNAYMYNGSIAIVRIYNRALTAAEVTQNYNEQKVRFGL